MNRRWLAVASRCGAFAALSCAAALGSCRKTTHDAGTGAPGGDATPVGSLSAAPEAIDAGGLIVARHRACRVMALRGAARVTPRFPGPSRQTEGGRERTADGAAGRAPTGAPGAEDAAPPQSLAQGDLLPEGGLLELGQDTELTVQATVSTREITLVGPATAEACPGGDEAVRLSRGRVTANPGAGVRPGAEVWIATPLGVVRFSDAKIDIAVLGSEADRLRVAVISGQATFVPANGVVPAGPPVGRADGAGRVASSTAGNDASVGSADAPGPVMTLSPGSLFEASRRAGAVSRWSRDLVAVCLRQAGASKEAAELVASPRDGASFGALAFAHVSARHQARAACESAWAAGALAPGLLDGALRADLEGADATWKGTPVPPRLSSGAPSRAGWDAESLDTSPAQ